MTKHRAFIAAFLAIWLVLGPASGSVFAAADTPCERMSMPADDDCCGGDSPAAIACAGLCATAASGIAFSVPQLVQLIRATDCAIRARPRYASRTVA
jgi:hypothetical protein